MKTRKLVDEFIISCRSRNLSKSTIKWYTSLLGRFAKAYKELPETRGAIEGFFAGVGGSDENKHAFYRALKGLYNYAAGCQDLMQDKKARELLALGIPLDQVKKVLSPMGQVIAPRRRKKSLYYLSAFELGILLALPMSARDHAFISLLVDTGVRVGEALSLVAEDIHEDVIMVNGKVGEREVPISLQVRQLLLGLNRRGPIFTGTKGPLTREGAYDIVRGALQAADIRAKKWGPHTLRHTFGRQYILAGGDVASLQRLMGHANIRTTQIYAEMDLRDITAQHARFSPYLAAQKSAQGLLFTRPGSDLSAVSKN